VPLKLKFTAIKGEGGKPQGNQLIQVHTENGN